jgi:hypothetical protein
MMESRAVVRRAIRPRVHPSEVQLQTPVPALRLALFHSHPNGEEDDKSFPSRLVLDSAALSH